MSRIAAIRLLSVYAVAGVLTTLAFYWDEVWHTDKGRDSFWIPAHQMLYGSVAALLVVVIVWAALLRRQGETFAAIARHWPLVLAFTGTAVTLLDAPIDGVWHNVFGRDAVFWSPPHVLAVAGLTTTACGMLLKAGELRGRAGDVLTVITAGLVMSALVVLVMEYDSDVPQFSTLWYLPVITVTASYTLALARRVSRLTWTGTLVTLLYALIMVAVVVFLKALGHSTPIIPALVLPGIVFDLTSRARVPVAVRATCFAVAIYATYTLYLNTVLSGVRIEPGDIVWGLPLATVLSWAMLWLIEGRRPRGRTVAAPALAGVIALLALLPATARAHDPGQGPKAGFAQLTAHRTNNTVTVTGRITEPAECDLYSARGLVARRAREEVRAPLARGERCTFGGEIQLPERGRWFVYLELDRQGEAVEVWLPVIAGEGTKTFEKRSWIYIPPERTVNEVSVISGAIIYAVSLALFGMNIVAFRRRDATNGEDESLRGG